MLQGKYYKTHKTILKLSIFEWLMFFVSSAIMAAIILIFWNQMPPLGIAGWVCCLVWMLIARAYKGMVNALKEHNEELVELVIELSQPRKDK